MRHFLLAAAAVALVTSGPVLAQSAAERTAAAALEAAPVWDGHNDVPIQLRSRFGNVIGDFDFSDTLDTQTSERSAMHSDLARLRQGMVGAQWWSVYVSPGLPEAEAVQATVEQIDVTKRLIARYPDALQLALTADDVEQAMGAGRIASLLGMEGGHSIGSSLAVLRQMYAMGARYMTLTHGKTLSWADSATDTPQHGGLNAFGMDVVREMNRIGMLVDLSHVSEEAMMDALDVAQAPVIFSHSGARAITGHLRNVPDSVLARLPENGGIVMAVALPWFITEDLRQHSASRAAEEARLEALYPGLPDTVEAQLAKWDAENRAPVGDRPYRDRRRLRRHAHRPDRDGGRDRLSRTVRRTGAARLFAGRSGEDRFAQHDARHARGRSLCCQRDGHGAARIPRRRAARRGRLTGWHN